MSTPSQVLPVLRQLRDLFAAGTYPDLVATDDGDVDLGPVDVLLGMQLEGDDPQRRVYVGWGGDPNDLTMARFRQTYVGAGLGAKRKNEPFDVPCAVVVWSGDDDVEALDEVLLQAAADVFAVVEAALRADPGMARPGPFLAQITDGAVVPDASLLRVRLPFTVNISGRI